MSYRTLLLLVLLVPAALLGGAKALGVVIPVPIWGREYVLQFPFEGEAAATLELPRVEGPDDPSRPLVVIAGMMANKDAGAFLANFAGLTRHIVTVPIPGRDNAMLPDRLADAARALGMRVENAAGVEAALHALSRLAYEVPPRILISGSLYLAGHVLDINGTPPA